MRLLLSVLLFAGCVFAQPVRRATSEFFGANLPSQPVGPNDLIAVSVYDAPELSRTIRIGADGFFGELGVIDDAPRSATIVALEPTECALLGAWDGAVADFWHVRPRADVAAIEDEHEGTGGRAADEAEEASTG